MPHGDKKTPEARAATDASLKVERTRTDEELARRRGQEEDSADAALRTSRANATRSLHRARRQDDKRAEATPSVRAERSRADAAIARERADADETLEAERVRRHVALAGLLLAERQRTDSKILLERERADEVLTRRDDFLAMLSHDLRSLLAGVALNAAMLDRKGHDPSRASRYTGSIQRAIAQMSRLVADVLDVASFDAGKFILVPALLDGGRMAREAADAFEPTAAERNIEMSVEVPSEALIAKVDADRIGQVFANLLGNAAKFTRAGGKITVGAARRGDDILFSVADSGEGIPSDKLQTIFDRYAQLGGSHRGGLGLGLHIARRIVEAHGGRIWAESSVGRGSTFFFTVPTAAKPGARGRPGR